MYNVIIIKKGIQKYFKRISFLLFLIFFNILEKFPQTTHVSAQITLLTYTTLKMTPSANPATTLAKPAPEIPPTNVSSATHFLEPPTTLHASAMINFTILTLYNVFHAILPA